MQGSSRVYGSAGLILCALILCAGTAHGQTNPDPPSSHVIIPNPTPRQPDLEKVYGDNPSDRKKQEALSLQSQVRAREIWLESNQILLLAQQLQEEIVSKKSASMAANAAKVGQIEKLAQSVQEKMKEH
jgi:hypothetical protein